MKILSPSLSGFCPGVNRADKKIMELVQSQPKETIYILGSLINNDIYIKYLKKQNIITVNKPEEIPDKQWAVIRTHGIAKQIQSDLQKRCKLLDLTCPKVKKIHKQISLWSELGYFMILNGEDNHPETIGNQSYGGEQLLVSKNFDSELVYKQIENLSLSKKYEGLFFTSQSTGHHDTFSRLCDFAKDLKSKGRNVEIYDSICPVILKKEEDSELLQKRCSKTIVIGDKKSSNANRLYNRLSKNNDNCYFIENLEALKDKHIKFKSDDIVLVVSSASTPNFTEKNIIDFLKSKT